MKITSRLLTNAVILLMLSTSLSGCFATMHVVGEGGTYDGKSIPEYDVKKKKWYLFSGIPLMMLLLTELQEGPKTILRGKL